MAQGTAEEMANQHLVNWFENPSIAEIELREFTKAAMQGLCASYEWMYTMNKLNPIGDIAIMSVTIAQATLAELNKHKP